MPRSVLREACLWSGWVEGLWSGVWIVGSVWSDQGGAAAPTLHTGGTADVDCFGLRRQHRPPSTSAST